MSSQNKVWFKRKRYGWGWSPATWQGWMITAFYVAIVSSLAFLIKKDSTVGDALAAFLLPVFFVTVLFIGIAYKTGEKPRWQWGEKE